jgi:hypothetical protein
MFQIAMTPQEKKMVYLYWEEQRLKARTIRDEYDRSQEERYHVRFYNRHRKNEETGKCNKNKETEKCIKDEETNVPVKGKKDDTNRPDFFSPMPTRRKITK